MQKIIKIKFFSILLVFLFTNCSGQYRRPESVEEKIRRYESRNGNIEAYVPQIPTFSYDFEDRSDSRTVSSLITKKKKASSTEKLSPEFSPYSHKQIYFLTLYSQYFALRVYTGESAPDIEFCPQFHSALVDFQKDLSPYKTSAKLWSLKHARYQDIDPALYPELFLSLSRDSLHPTIFEEVDESVDEVTTDHLQKAFALHLEKSYREIKQLCETGQSSPYFAFENLVTYIEGNPSFGPSQKSLKALLKVSIFTNTTLLNSLRNWSKEGRQVASLQGYSKFEEEAFARVQGYWIKDYLSEFERRRKIAQSEL